MAIRRPLVLVSGSVKELPTGDTLPGAAGTGLHIGDTPPADPVATPLWWHSGEGQLKIYYDDGTSAQWVDAAVGPAGPAGDDGADGTVWREGTGAPSNAVGVDGDFYLDDANGDVYQRAAGTYSVVANIKGVQGDPGTNGTNGTTEIVFSIPGALAVGSFSMRFYLDATKTISKVIAHVGTAPTGASLIFDVNKNGTTIFTTQGNRPTIAASGFSDMSSVPDVTALAANDFLTVDIDQIGSTVAGADAVIRIVLA